MHNRNLPVHRVIGEVHMAADDEHMFRPKIDGAIGINSHKGVVLSEHQLLLIEIVIYIGARSPYLFHLD